MIKSDFVANLLRFLTVVLLLLLFLHTHGWAQGSSPTGQDTYDRTNHALKVNVVAGGGTGGGPSDTAANAAASESDTGRQKVTSAIRVLDVAQAAGSQLVTAKGDQTSGLWVNCKAGCAAAGDTIGASQSLAALNNAASVALAGGNGTSVLFSGAVSPSFTVVPEVSPDGGTTWQTAVFFDPVSGAMSTSLVNPANGTWQIAYLGFETNARVRVSAFTSGSITAQLRSGVTRPWNISGGSDGTNLRIFKVDSSGDLNVVFPSAQTVTANAGSGTFNIQSNASVNVAQLAGTTTDTNSGNKSAGTLRVVLATDQPQLTNALKVDGSGVTQPVSGTVTANQGTSPWVTQDNANGATGAAPPARAIQTGGSDGTNLVGYYVDPCQRAARTRVAINITANTQEVTGAASKQTYICDLDIVAGAATNIALVEGTGSVCATGIAGMAGGTTAATGWNFAANGGLTKGNGAAWVYKTNTAADNVCLLVSAANQVSGSFSYVQF